MKYNECVEVDFIDIDEQSKEDKKNYLIHEILNYLSKNEKKHFEELGKPENHIYGTIEELKLLLD